MTTIKPKLRPSSVPGRPGSIVYAVTYRRITRQVTTNFKVFPCEWDNNRQTIVDTKDESRASIIAIISQRMKWDLARLKSIAAKCEETNEAFSADDIVSEFQRQSQQQSFFRYMQSIIARLRQLNRTGTANNYQFTLNSFARFRHDQDIRLEELSSTVVEEYEAWLKAQGVRPNSSSFYMRNMRAVYNRAVENELVTDSRPFRKAFTGIVKTAKRAISIKEIKRIKELDLTLTPNLELARDIFMFQFYAMGISFIDAAFLTRANIKGDTIVYRRHKTNQEIIVPLNSHIQAILHKYQDHTRPYLLPIITIGYEGNHSYTANLRKTNSHLKQIGSRAGISTTLTTYVARHSWASIAKEKGIDIATISDALGHENIKTTEIYLSSIGTDKLCRANARILRDL